MYILAKIELDKRWAKKSERECCCENFKGQRKTLKTAKEIRRDDKDGHCITFLRFLAYLLLEMRPTFLCVASDAFSTLLMCFSFHIRSKVGRYIQNFSFAAASQLPACCFFSTYFKTTWLLICLSLQILRPENCIPHTFFSHTQNCTLSLLAELLSLYY